MKILAFSDIHNNLDCLDRLILQSQQVEYDCIVIAGDIGSECIDEFFNKLSHINCPIYYVLGNWDSKVPYDKNFAPNVVHLHGKIVENSGYYFTGYSGCQTHWGKNDIYEKTMANNLTMLRGKYSKLLKKVEKAELKLNKTLQKSNHAVTPEVDDAQSILNELIYSSDYFEYQGEREFARKEVYHNNRQMIFELISKKKEAETNFNPNKVIVITHDKFGKLNQYLPWRPLAHLFGHKHNFQHKKWQGIHFINISHLDDKPHEHLFYKEKTPAPTEGSYCIIELNENDAISTKIKLD